MKAWAKDCLAGAILVAFMIATFVAADGVAAALQLLGAR
jgi:hypothetical protein